MSESVYDSLVRVERDEKSLMASLDRALDVLSEPTSTFDSQAGYEALFFIGQRLSAKPNLAIIDFDIFCKKNAYETFGNYLQHLHAVSDQYDIAKCTLAVDVPNAAADANERLSSAFCLLFYILNKVFVRSILFSLKFQTSVGLRAMFAFLGDERFLAKYVDTSQSVFHSGAFPLVDDIILNVFVLSKSSDEFRATWMDVGAIEALAFVAKVKPSVQQDVYMTMVNVADDNQIEHLDEIRTLTRVLVDQFNQCVMDFNDKRLNRTAKCVIENFQIEVVEIHAISVDRDQDSRSGDQENVDDEAETTVSMLSILDAMYRLAVNDLTRLKFFFKYLLSANLKVVLFLGNAYERKLCLKLMAQLVFNRDINAHVLKDKEFLAVLNQIFKETATDDKYDVKRICDLIHWSLVAKQKRLTRIRLRELPLNERKHLMISSSPESRDTCLKIKARLEARGYTVWADMNDELGTVDLEAMAKRIEECYFFLVCVSEKYRQNIECQIECQYAYDIKKPIIPLIMQTGYRHVGGWLGAIIASKISVNFSKNSFDDNVAKLVLLIKPEIYPRSAMRNENKPEAARPHIIKSLTSWGDETETYTPPPSVRNPSLLPKRTSVVDVEEERPASVRTHTRSNIEPPLLKASTLPIIPVGRVATTTTESAEIGGELSSKAANGRPPESMSETEVHYWLEANRIDRHIISYLVPLDGEVLKQIYDMRMRNTGFFDQSFFKVTDIDFISIARFAVCLEKLFKHSQPPVQDNKNSTKKRYFF